MWSTNIVVHVGGAEDKDARVVGKLSIVDIGAVRFDVSAVVDAVTVVHEPDAPHPVPRRFGPVGVCLVSGVACQSGAEVEETACIVMGQLKIHRIQRVLLSQTIGNAVLVVVSVVERGNLPAQATIAGFIVSIGVCLCVEDSLGEAQPLWLIGWWIRKIVFGGCHGRHSPEALIIVS